MKVVTIQQNSKLWHEWRGKGLGASDAPVITEDSPWQTPFALWGEKTGLVPRAEPNAFALAAMKRGQDMEPEARDLYVKLTGRTLLPLAGEHEVHTFLRASFDGIEPIGHGHFVEIKCPGAEAHNKAKKGQVPEYYKAQIQQQFLVSGAKSADYFSYRPGDEVPHKTIPVLPDPVYQAELLTKLIAFWNLVQTKTPPTVGRLDFVAVLKQAKKDLERAKASVDALQLMWENLA